MRDKGGGVSARRDGHRRKDRAVVERVMRERSFKQTAQRVAASFARFDPYVRFRAVVDEVIAHGSAANGSIGSTAVTQISGQHELA